MSLVAKNLLANSLLRRVIFFSLVGGVIGGSIGSIFDHWDTICQYGRKLKVAIRNMFYLEWWATGALIEPEEEVEWEFRTDVCKVCYNLSVHTPHRYDPDLKMRINPDGKVDVQSTNKSPPFPMLWEWLASAIEGCPSCQIVVDAIAAFYPHLFDEYDPEHPQFHLPGIYLRAIANQGSPLTIGVIRPWHEWSSERKEYLEIFTDIGAPQCWPSIWPAHAVCANNSSPAALQKIKRWLETCIDKHGIHCKVPNPSYIPRRLVKINHDGNIQLIRPKARVKYLAISYCWGSEAKKMLRTVRSNYEMHKISIAKSLLPQGLIDAIDLAREIDFDYIWIDALCIIQDDKQDMEAEFPVMGKLYANADLVIAIDTVAQSHQSFRLNQAYGSSIHFGFENNGVTFKKTFQVKFRRRSENGTDYKPLFLRALPSRDHHIDLYMGIGAYGPVNWESLVPQPGLQRPLVPIPWSPENNLLLDPSDGKEEEIIFVREARLACHMNVSIQDHWKMLDRRGWTLQECRLASRLLTLGTAEMRWSCSSTSLCECYEAPTGMEKTEAFVEHTPAPQRRALQAKQRIQERQRKFYFDLSRQKPKHGFQIEDIYEAWENLITDYSARHSTNPSDKISALAGITIIYEEALCARGLPKNQDLHGLWKGNILRGLLWRSISWSSTNATDVYASSVAMNLKQPQMLSQADMLSHLRLDSLGGNFLLLQAYFTGMPCFASSIYWPTIQQFVFSDTTAGLYPSWSWQSNIGTVKYWDWIYGSLLQTESQLCNSISFKADADVLTIGVENQLVQLSGLKATGAITLSCRATPVRLKSLIHGIRRPQVDFCQLYEVANFDSTSQALPFLIPALLDSSLSFAWIEGTNTPMLLLTDSACLFGANVYEVDDINQWLIDLLKKEYKYRLEERNNAARKSAKEQAGNTTSEAHGSGVASEQQADSTDSTEEAIEISLIQKMSRDLSHRHDFKEFMPCVESEQPVTGFRSVQLCSKATCNCKKRWTDPETYPAIAVYIGSAVLDGEDGKRTIMRFSLILVPSIHSPGTYRRIGIAHDAQFTGLSGYCDPYHHVERREITIV